MFDDRNINQPTGSTSAIGDFPSYNFMSDITKRGQIFGIDSTTLIGGWYNTLSATSNTFNVMPGGEANLGLLQSSQLQSTTNYGVRAREELKLVPSLTAVAGIGWETTTLNGVNTLFQYNTPNVPTATIPAPTTANLSFKIRHPNSHLSINRAVNGYGVPA